MGSNSGSEVCPLLEEEEEAKQRKWWSRVVDIKEAKHQVLFSLPMILTNVSYYFITLVSVMFAGHLGQLQLAAANLANSWCNVSGFAFIVGLSGALETLCGQGYGAKQYRILGMYLQASCVVSLFFAVLISIFWLYTKPIMILLHQEPQISEAAAQYIKYLIPGLFAYCFIHNFLRFLQTQSVVAPLIVCSLIPLLTHMAIAYLLVYHTPLAFKGAALAASISLSISAFMLGTYILFSKNFQHTWGGFSLHSFSYVLAVLKLALPSAAMLCLECWAMEILVLLSGLMPDSEITTSLIGMCANTEIIAYMFAYGLSAAASTRVSNELGANNPEGAKHAMGVTLKLSVLLVVVVVSTLAAGHEIWAGLFSGSSIIIKNFAAMTPLLVVSMAFDSLQSILSGVARGCGWQNWAVIINFTTFYLVGMTISVLLGFKLRLHAKGLWLGLICGLTSQSLTLLLLTQCSKWRMVELPGNGNKENPILL